MKDERIIKRLDFFFFVHEEGTRTLFSMICLYNMSTYFYTYSYLQFCFLHDLAFILKIKCCIVG